MKVRQGHDGLRPVHERVRDHVAKSKIDLDELADACGMNRQRIRRLLKGRTRLLAEDVELIAGVIEKSVGTLYRDIAKAA